MPRAARQQIAEPDAERRRKLVQRQPCRAVDRIALRAVIRRPAQRDALSCSHHGRLETLKVWSQPKAKLIFQEIPPKPPTPAIVIATDAKCPPEKIAESH